jgi:predicted nucleic acid-binding protein
MSAMELVVDTSVLIAVAANEPEKPQLLELTTGATLYAPPSLRWEVGNAFAAMMKRRRINIYTCNAAVQAIERIPIRIVDVSLGDSLDIANQLGIYAYDAYMIAAALQQGCPLLTLDRGLVQAARSKGVNVVEVAR